MVTIKTLLFKSWRKKRSSYKERKGNALAPGADEGRSDLRKATARRKQPATRGYPNGETRQMKNLSTYGESNSRRWGTA